MDLPEKYHPRLFEDIVGQGEAIKRLNHKLQQGQGMKLLFHGPTGTGKSSMARIVAQSTFCQERAVSGSPCRTCHDCLEVERGQRADRYHFINAADHGRVVTMSAMVEIANEGYKFVAVIDEAHQLETKAAELLLSQTDLPPEQMTLILCTSNLDLLKRKSRPLVDRFDAIFIGRPTREELMLKLVSVARSEGLEIVPSVANRIVESSDGSVRSLLKIIQALIESGGTEEALELAIAWRSADHAGLEFLEACATEPIFGSVVSRLQSNSPEAFRAGVENQLARLLISSSMGSAMHGADQVIHSAVHAAAQSSRRVVANVWEELIEIWKPNSATSTNAQLVRLASMTHRLIGGSGRPAVDAYVSIPAAHTIRRLSRGEAGDRFLSKAQVQKLWHAASSYSQTYGEGIRVLMEVHHANAEAAAPTMSRLTHGLSANYARYQSFLPPLGWIYLNSRTQAGVPASTLALFLPTSLMPRMQIWIERAAERIVKEGLVSVPPPVIGPSTDAQFQLKALRAFAAFLDPTILEVDANGMVRPLIDVLGVAESSRRALGSPFGRYTVRLSQSLADAVRSPHGNDAFFYRESQYLSEGQSAWDRNRHMQSQVSISRERKNRL